MKRQHFYKSLAAAAILLLSATMFAGNGHSKKPVKHKPVYCHYLLFWLDPKLSPEQLKDFENFFEGLKKLPYQKNLRYGVAAKSTPRAVLDNSFTYNAVMEFDSLEELEAYGKLPGHIALVNQYKPFFVKMMVHDSVIK